MSGSTLLSECAPILRRSNDGLGCTASKLSGIKVIASLHHRSRTKMHAQNLFGRLPHLDLLRVATDECQYRALAVTPHAPDQRNVDVIGQPRLKLGAFNPEAHDLFLLGWRDAA